MLESWLISNPTSKREQPNGLMAVCFSSTKLVVSYSSIVETCYKTRAHSKARQANQAAAAKEREQEEEDQEETE